MAATQWPAEGITFLKGEGKKKKKQMKRARREKEGERPKTVDGMMGNEGGTDGEAQRG